MAAAFLLSGCMGSQVSSTLETAALTSGETPTIATHTNGFASGDPMGSVDGEATTTLSAIPVPVRSPVAALDSGESLALLPENEAPAVAAVESSLVTSAQETTAASTVTNSGEELAAISQETQDGETVPVPAAPETIEPVAAKPAAQPKKPVGLFALFMAKKQQAPKPAKPVLDAKSAGNSAMHTASASATSSRQASSALPGVKQGSAIFGIDGNDAADDDDQSIGDAEVQVASVGGVGRMMSPNGLVLQTPKVEVGCLKPELLSILKQVERRYGKKVMVTSGYRSPSRNRRAGGVSNSTHIYCKAADIQVDGISKWDLAKYLRSVPGRGGVGTYCRTNSVHIDVGSQRDWHYPCRRSGSRAKKKA